MFAASHSAAPRNREAQWPQPAGPQLVSGPGEAPTSTEANQRTESRAMRATAATSRPQATRSQRESRVQQDTITKHSATKPQARTHQATQTPSWAPPAAFCGQPSPRPLLLLAALVWLLLAQAALCQLTSTTEATTASPELSGTPTELPTGGGDSETSFEATTASNSASANQNTTKLKPVNFTLVDEVFDSVLSDDEVVGRWRLMDSQLQDGMKSILKMLFPQIVALSQDAKVSGDCSGGILKWILSLRNLRSWAIKMLDATGKPTAGIFEGSLTMFGNYRQCLSIRAPDEDEIEITEQFEEYFRGQFCVIHLKPWMPAKRPFYHLNSTIEPLLRRGYKYYEKTLYDELAEIAIAFNFVDIRMDLCVPSTCTMADIQRVAELLSKKVEMRAKVMRCDTAPREPSSLAQLDRLTCYWLAAPVTLVLLATLATLLQALRGLGSGHESQDEDRGSGGRRAAAASESRLSTVLRCLSIGGAIGDRLSMPPGNSPPPKSGEEEPAEQVAEPQVSLNLQRKPLPLYGLRNLFIFWFLVVQMTVELKYQYLRESLVLRNMIIGYWPFQAIVNSSLLFESLILITSFTFSYTCLEATMKDLLGYVVDKYIRLVLPIVSVIALTIVTPLISIESPVWRNFVDQQSSVCKSNGYLDLFFLQNFISYDKICLPHTWLLCVELQLIILSVPLVLLLKRTFLSTEDSVIVGQAQLPGDKRNSHKCLTRVAFGRFVRSRAGLLSLLLLAAGLLINFLSVLTNQLPPAWFYTFPDVEQRNYYFTAYLTKTWTHLAAFVVGLVGGHICRSSLQLRTVTLLKRRQLPEQQPGPNGAGSASTIMAMEQEKGDSSAELSPEPRRARRLRALARVSSQLAAACCMAAIVLSTHSWSTGAGPTPLVAALYDSGSRLLWALALVGLMVQLCLPDELTGRHSLAARALSHPLCTLLGRLSFLAYLLSPYVHTFVLAVGEQSLFPSLFLIFHLIVGNIVITYVLAFLVAIVIEQPLRRLISRFVLGTRFRKQKINISTYYTDHAQTGSISTISGSAKATN